MAQKAGSGRWQVMAVLLALSIAACGDGDGSESAGTTAETSTTTSSPSSTSTSGATAPSTSTTPAPAFPEPRLTLEHGGPTWAVVLAGSPDFDDPALVRAEEAAERAGYTSGRTDCDEGASEALGLTDSFIYTVSVYFDSRPDAEQALGAFRARDVDGVVAEVKTFCLD